MKKPSTYASDREGRARSESASSERMLGERLQKVLARAGIASRRQCEVFIVEGRVKVNGEVVTELGTRVHPERDRLEFDGRRVDPDAPRLRYYMLYKPTGYLSTVSDPHGRQTVLELVPSEDRLYPVGRLDYNSEGLMLLTNDGALTHRLLHPRFQHEREYLVLVPGQVPDDIVTKLEAGVMVGEPPILARAHAQILGRRWHWRNYENPPDSTWLRMVLREGHKREIRYMLQAVGYEVQRLIRVRFDQLEVGELQPGEGRWLTPREASALREAVGLPAQPRPLSTGVEREPARGGRNPRLREGTRNPRDHRHESTRGRGHAPADDSGASRERRPAGRRPATSSSAPRRPRQHVPRRSD